MLKYTPYSFSKIQTYNSCPNKFKLNYIDKIKIKAESLALDKGTYYHESLENDMLYDKKPLEFKSKFLESNSEKEEIQNKIKEVLNSKRYKSLKKAFHNAEFKEVELGIGFNDKIEPLSYEEGTLFRGYIDLVLYNDKKGLILDYKSGKYKPMKYQDFFQGELYALWLNLKYNIEDIDVVFYYIEHDKINKKTYTDFDKLKVKFKDNLYKIEKSKEFNKNISKLCPYCQYFNEQCEFSDKELLDVL